jgi:hypothetical protein
VTWKHSRWLQHEHFNTKTIQGDNHIKCTIVIDNRMIDKVKLKSIPVQTVYALRVARG